MENQIRKSVSENTEKLNRLETAYKIQDKI